ncbi:MAG: Gfo/Idh/MocA family oxidoreductase, partial [Bacteroidales bacterium]|nr:Gfo/Idh/MocA family oxidoreductase [Bacteroidales bacterium]
MRNKISYHLVLSIALIALTIVSCNKPASKENLFQAVEVFPTPERPEGQTHVLGLRAEPIDTVRIAIIGLGMRGLDAVQRLSHIGEVKIVAISDVVPTNVQKAQDTLKMLGKPEAAAYTAKDSWKDICERNDIDLVYICTHWDLHTPISVYAMEHGKHVACEVPAALTIKEAWQLVNTAEKTRKHFMMLENCNYDFFELTTLNMAQQG